MGQSITFTSAGAPNPTPPPASLTHQAHTHTEKQTHTSQTHVRNLLRRLEAVARDGLYHLAVLRLRRDRLCAVRTGVWGFKLGMSHQSIDRVFDLGGSVGLQGVRTNPYVQPRSRDRPPAQGFPSKPPTEHREPHENNAP